MINTKFICKKCNKHFYLPDFYEENHELDSPPYERVSICPNCKSSNFIQCDALIEKTEVAERLLDAILLFNCFINEVKSVFGSNFKNENLFDGVGTLTDLICEMFEYLPQSIEQKILNLDKQKELEVILLYLKGEL
ncbi:MAG: hypothetical protein Q4B40_05750 [Clostridia bacterium]|nr:hypothetical protein [Clostridia bacterium]